MSRYYKPNNSTILYLNTSFNCIKSNSITITKTGNGTGYTSAPTVVIIPANGDMGTGAAATIAAPVSGVLSGALTMVSNGRGYNTLPTIELVGGGNPGTITEATITNQGSGYTSVPTVSITGGGGTGATATANISGGKVISLNITNGGTNYSTTPTITITGGGGSGATATPVLTLGTRATFTVAFTRTFTYTWNIPDININDLGKLSVINIVGTSVAATPYIFRIMGLQYDSRNSFFSDYGNPILSMTQMSNTFTSLGSTGSNNYYIILSPQTIRQIQISIDDSITEKDTGVAVANSNFIMALEIEEYDPVLTRIDDPYQESLSKLKLSY